MTPDESVIVTFADLRPFTEEETVCAMPRTAPGASVSAELPSCTAPVAGVASSWKRSSCGITSCTRGVADALDAGERAGDLALERALGGDLLLELGSAELGLVEQFVAGLRAAARRLHTLRGERDARLRHLRLRHGETRAVVLDLVRDALLVERGRDLARLGGIEARRDRRVRRRRRDLEHDERDAEDGDRGDGQDGLRLGGQREDVLDEGRHEEAVELGLDLGLEDGLGGLDGLGADLAGHLHRELRALDGHDDRGRVGGLARGQA